MSGLFAKISLNILGDPKLLRAARDGAKELDLTPWLIVFAKRADDGGRLSIAGKPANARDIAHDIPNATPRRIANSIRELTEIDVLVADEDGCPRFRTWGLHQSLHVGESKSAGAVRQQRYRENLRRERAELRGAPAVDNVENCAVTRDAQRDERALRHSDARPKTGDTRHKTVDTDECDARPSLTTESVASDPYVDEDPEVQAVLKFYVLTHPRRRVSSNTAKMVRRAFKMGYSSADVCDAITGNAIDDWHAKKHKHELSYVLRNEEKIDQFREMAAAARAPSAETRQLVHDGVLTEFGDRASRPDLRSVV